MTDREPVNIMGVIAFPEPDKRKRRIRFIDPEYNTLFYIPDGASIVMTRMDGSTMTPFPSWRSSWRIRQKRRKCWKP